MKIFRRTKVLWYELLNSLTHTCPTLCIDFTCFPVAVLSLPQPGYVYFKRRDGLPDPKGSLSQSISSAAIASINQKVIEPQRNQ